MPTIMPHSELVRKAAEFIGLEIKFMREDGGAEPTSSQVYELVEKACLKFDLSQREAEMLHDFLERGKTED